MVEMDSAIGTSNGTVDGKRYCSLGPNLGVLAGLSTCTKIERKVVFTKGANGFGVNFGGAKHAPDYGVFLSYVAPTGEARQVPFVTDVVGWQVMALEGYDLERSTIDELMTQLKRVGQVMARCSFFSSV
jgi:hypothetical protein